MSDVPVSINLALSSSRLSFIVCCSVDMGSTVARCIDLIW